MSDTPEMNEIRQSMKQLIFEFNKEVHERAESATAETRDKIEIELERSAEKFAKKYGDLQSRYTDLMFHQDLKEMVDKGKADLFLKVMMFRNAENN